MFVLLDLPYDLNALEPVTSAKTLEHHHGAHHAAYIKKTNELAKAQGLEGVPLEEVVRLAWEKKERPLFNNAAQAWNHDFFWRSMKPAARAQQKQGALAEAAARAFGGPDGLRTQFLEKGAAHFGSGWIWLLAKPDGALALETTKDAETPIAEAGKRPLFVCDLWEHAYYLDHQQKRPAYLEGWFDTLLDWEFAARQHEAALKGEDGWRRPPPSG